MKEEPGQHLYCIDWDAVDIELFGSEVTGNAGFIEIMVLPCNMNIAQEGLGGTEADDRIDSECVWDLDK